MECVMDFPQLWELEFVGDQREDLCDGEQSFSLGGKLWVWERSFEVLSL